MIGSEIVVSVDVVISTAAFGILLYIWLKKKAISRFYLPYIFINSLIILSLFISSENMIIRRFISISFVAIVALYNIYFLVKHLKKSVLSPRINSLLMILPIITLFYILPYSVYFGLVEIAVNSDVQYFILVSFGQMLLGHNAAIFSYNSTVRQIGILFFLLGFAVFLVGLSFFLHNLIPFADMCIIIVFSAYILLIMIISVIKGIDSIVKNYNEP